MTWYRSFSGFELLVIAIFILLYVAYLFRMLRIGKILKISYRALITKTIIRSAYFLLFLVALLGPSFGDTSREVKAIGKDIMICVDLSESMNAHDIQPTRLEKVKFELKNLVDAFNSDRIGLIIFSSESFMQCPLTYDQGALNLFIETLGTNLVPNAGTDFGPPIEMALEKLSGEEATSTQQKSKTIILISDGEDFGENTLSNVSNLEENGIKLFTLGVGTKSGSRIKTNYGFKTDKNGREVFTKLNAKDLKTLAIKTGGKYFEINEESNGIERLINAINSIEGELKDSRIIDVSANKYYYFVALALILICADLLIGLKTVYL
ncbi:MAG: VWA domain-containing protein [Cyclobacteriaceae bacterium]|nr:VWA domain-containing protein [Cyclobacteriaceae bacterium]MCK5210586.1 VWA domain-containing protein [Cyclobacteriaceae bacterium]MCK5366963.1 VWA domain-containing protein [Cyclobacteriaceae bacterium]MCK5700450.1 VWA domain-containing protein [Cyclobacteriaceae bacterium]